jgi:hypothetical protein
VAYRKHAEAAMTRRQLDILDVQPIGQHGSIISHERRRGQWRYRIQGAAVDERTASVVVAIEGPVLIVPVLDYRGTGREIAMCES